MYNKSVFFYLEIVYYFNINKDASDTLTVTGVDADLKKKLIILIFKFQCFYYLYQPRISLLTFLEI